MGAEAKPRILCLMQLPPPVHGVTAVNQAIADSAVLRDQFSIEVVPLRFAEAIEDVGRPTLRKLSLAAITGARLTWALAVRRPDGVYFTIATRGGAFLRDCLYVAIIRAFGVPRLYHLHAKGIAEQLGTSWKRALYGWAFRDAWVIHLSPLLDMDTAGLVDRRRVLYVANGVPDSPETSGDPHTPPRILFLANMIVEKGPLELLRALAMIAERGVEFDATFAGARHRDNCVEQFESDVQRLGLTDRVRYVGPVYGEAKAQLYRSHDVFVCPSYFDAFPLVVLEAMSHALPVVGTREGAIPEMIVDGVTGFLVDKRDPADLADKLLLLVQDATLREQMGRSGRDRYLQHYTLARFEARLADALRAWLRDAR